MGRQIAAKIKPTSDLATAQMLQKETTEAKFILEKEGKIPFAGVKDVRFHVEKARLQSMLQARELLEVRETLGASRRLRSFLMRMKDKCPLVTSIAGRIVTFERIEEEIRRCIADSGDVMDAASQALASARSGIKTAHSRLKERLQSILQSSALRTAIQDPVITLREDRYCIPIKSEYRSQVPGIIHDSSASGATLFVEPVSVVELGNDLKQLIIKEREEIEKVLVKLTALVTASAVDIEYTLDAIGQIDYISARARLSLAHDAVEPELNDRGYLELRDARHPLLTGAVVPIDVQLGKRFTTILITGPNTGGKTVTLKTIGLLTLMAQSGLHVPAHLGAKMAVFSEVFADIGDEQSIEQSLSTFSSHVGNIVRMIQGLVPNSLALLDEIGAGTDPAEGAALAKALLDHLVSKGARVVATTHYGELKEFAFVRDSVENASVEFDPETLKPTYRLITGVPGSSNAFAVAARLGMPEEIIQAAEADVFGDADSSAEMIRSIERTRREAMDERRNTERAYVEVEKLRKRLEENVRKLETARARARDGVREEAQNIIRKYTKRLDRTIDQLSKQKAETKRAEHLTKEAAKSLEDLDTRLVEIPDVVEEPEGDFTFTIGQRVRIATLHQEGILVSEVEAGEATVQIGSIKVTTPISALRPAREVEPKVETQAIPTSLVVQAQDVSPELKLIAQRVEQALGNLEKYLDDAQAGELEKVRIVHGLGTGALKKAVWQFLKDCPYVESYRLAERNQGGAGATIVEFKK